jgi:hypothetical protein
MSILIMCVGVCAYSFALSSLTSVLTTLDSQEANLKEKLNTLEELRLEYHINYDTFMKLRKAIKYDHSRNVSDRYELLNQLPKALNLELAIIMHEEMISKIPFFQKRNPHFISYICPLLKPIKQEMDDYILKENDPIDESSNFSFYFKYLSLFSCERLSSVCTPK